MGSNSLHWSCMRTGLVTSWPGTYYLSWHQVTPGDSSTLAYLSSFLHSAFSCPGTRTLSCHSSDTSSGCHRIRAFWPQPCSLARISSAQPWFRCLKALESLCFSRRRASCFGGLVYCHLSVWHWSTLCSTELISCVASFGFPDCLSDLNQWWLIPLSSGSGPYWV